MNYRRIGKSGLQVSVVGLGCNNFGMRTDLEGARSVIHAALDAGITLFDTADIYGGQGGSETMMGQVLGDRRKDIVLATKFGMQMDKEGVKKGGSRRYIMAAVEDSLRRLQTDWIDLYQLHAPDPMTPMEETLRALDDLVSSGKVRYVGCSNVPAWGVADAAWIAETRGFNGFISAQDEWSVLVRKLESELKPMCEHFGIGILPYFPLASGLLTGKFKKGEEMSKDTRLGAAKGAGYFDHFMTDEKFDVVAKLSDFAESRGHTILELAFSWLLAQQVVPSVIAGATKAEQVAANVKAADWVMTPEELAEIDKIAPR
ncbi:MAG TPA: aldo/keto reductase [Alphaproteobacteria bacterium]|jgi:aryl-alcohol dehydrogenase-like predicted oxidoreductase|nr:aldo/keto reductase [Alphaproteobacteria bacterium]